MNRFTQFLIVSLLLFGPVQTYTQEITDGLYTGFHGGLIPKYIIMEVKGDTAELEMFTRWQGAWLPCIGEWTVNYQPQQLSLDNDHVFRNEFIEIAGHSSKHNLLEGKAKNTCVGRVKFKLRKTGELPERFKQVRKEAMNFVRKNDEG